MSDQHALHNGQDKHMSGHCQQLCCISCSTACWQTQSHQRSTIVLSCYCLCDDQAPCMTLWTPAGRADYFGLAVNRAARFLGAACGGQVLAERGLVEEVVQYWHSLVYKYATLPMDSDCSLCCFGNAACKPASLLYQLLSCCTTTCFRQWPDLLHRRLSFTLLHAH